MEKGLMYFSSFSGKGRKVEKLRGLPAGKGRLVVGSMLESSFH